MNKSPAKILCWIILKRRCLTNRQVAPLAQHWRTGRKAVCRVSLIIVLQSLKVNLSIQTLASRYRFLPNFDRIEVLFIPLVILLNPDYVSNYLFSTSIWVIISFGFHKIITLFEDLWSHRFDITIMHSSKKWIALPFFRKSFFALESLIAL